MKLVSLGFLFNTEQLHKVSRQLMVSMETDLQQARHISGGWYDHCQWINLILIQILNMFGPQSVNTAFIK